MIAGFVEDCAPLLNPGTEFDPKSDAKLLEDRLLSLLPNPKPQNKVDRR